MNVITLVANLGTTHFVSIGDVLVRGILLPALFIFAVWGFIKTTQDFKEIDYDAPFEDEESETDTQERGYITCTCHETEEANEETPNIVA